MVSEPARGLFWSNSLISLIDPNIYAFPCCSANIVRTRDFITSPKETSQDAPDESPQDSASSFSLLSPLIPFLSAAFSSSSSSLTSPASPGLLWERSFCLCWGFIPALSGHPGGTATFPSHPQHWETGESSLEHREQLQIPARF